MQTAECEMLFSMGESNKKAIYTKGLYSKKNLVIIG